ncbi:MAG: SEL1-like repeat protein [Hydrogenophaga sp.]|uniref:SEL1-like repeat protein n=1 Tax=Hydrogenophaga sp. TaxID=1904254 RepID=UPI0025BA23DE|nr:SEL1-like repeat protein [Hydrogenophaga sp.]MBU7574962.1 SEL1-like repeat protein [Hydrogenophaga sp.]
MSAQTDLCHPRTLLGAALAVLSSVGDARYRAQAEFRLARYAQAREIWATLADEAGNAEALFMLGVLAEEGLGEPRNPARAEALYQRAAQAGRAT